MDIQDKLEFMRKDLNNRSLTSLRLEGWVKSISWNVDNNDVCIWVSNGKELRLGENFGNTDIQLSVTAEVLDRLYEKKMPFFLGLWATGEIKFEGSFSDAYKLGYIFLSDKRSRKIVFVAHCFLNINNRFPEGAAYPGLSLPLMRALIESGIGIVQMPCAEFKFLGAEKELYGAISSNVLRENFRALAESVVTDIVSYIESGFEIVGIIGMNPSPSCGVEITKGKETMMGTGRDMNEKPGSGLFIEELIAAAKERGIKDLPIFGFRRILPGETGIDYRLKELLEKLK